MGSFIYDRLVVEVDDRTLTHLQVVIVQKLRRNESFLLSWNESVASGSGRSSIWMHPTIPLRFKFFGNKTPPLNEEWIRDLIAAANSPRGLVILGESTTPSTVTSGVQSPSQTSVPVPVQAKQPVVNS